MTKIFTNEEIKYHLTEVLKHNQRLIIEYDKYYINFEESQLDQISMLGRLFGSSKIQDRIEQAWQITVSVIKFYEITNTLIDETLKSLFRFKSEDPFPLTYSMFKIIEAHKVSIDESS